VAAPRIAVAAATVLALGAGAATYLALAEDPPGSGPRTSAPTTAEPLLTDGLPGSLDEIVLGALDGGADRRLADLRNERPMVLNLFASTCLPCLREMPAIQAVHRDLGDRVTFVGLASGDTPAAALEIVARAGVAYPTFGDPEGRALTYFGGLTLPATVFVDAAGEVRQVHSRAVTEDELRRLIDDLLGVA
jgi:thiol-disulfide isomerase/thioredoxin